MSEFPKANDLSRMNEEDQTLIRRYIDRMAEVSRQPGGRSSSEIINAVYEEMPGIIKALKRYDFLLKDR